MFVSDLDGEGVEELLCFVAVVDGVDIDPQPSGIQQVDDAVADAVTVESTVAVGEAVMVSEGSTVAEGVSVEVGILDGVSEVVGTSVELAEIVGDGSGVGVPQALAETDEKKRITNDAKIAKKVSVLRFIMITCSYFEVVRLGLCV